MHVVTNGYSPEIELDVGDLSVGEWKPCTPEQFVSALHMGFLSEDPNDDGPVVIKRVDFSTGHWATVYANELYKITDEEVLRFRRIAMILHEEGEIKSKTLCFLPRTDGAAVFGLKSSSSEGKVHYDGHLLVIED